MVWGNWGDTEVICLKTSAVAGSLNLCPSGAMLWPGVLITLEVVEEEETQCWGTINLLLLLHTFCSPLPCSSPSPSDDWGTRIIAKILLEGLQC